ncbi:FG-GAP-like repeat-containing protein [Streptomyces sp. NPDC090075]|uniref:FG-GAP-like repeat-containing protein n=1 Tax=Streptomyces sp. NPDC090075 TaxID=3365937 RepID=UPI003809292B
MRVPTRFAAALLPVLATTALWAAPTAHAAEPALAVPDLTVVSWNICGEAGGLRGQDGYCPYRNAPEKKIEQVAQVVAERDADVVMLQEVCGGDEPGSHMDLLQQALGPAWSIRHATAARPDGRTDCRGVLTGDLGVLIAVKGTITSSVAENTLPDSPDDARTLPVLCVTVAGWATTPCTTHLLPGDEDRAAGQVRNTQEFLAGHVPGDVVLGGDFNRNTDAPALSPLTSGMERCVDATSYHGWDSATQQHTWHRLDHFFVTLPSYGTRAIACDVDTSRMDTTPNEADSGDPDGYSDHAPIIGTFRGAPVAGDLTGDGRPDLVAVDTDGKLRLYGGLGTGAVTGGHTVIGNGGWRTASVTHRGDFTGDGREDVVARVGTELRVYPNKGDGSLGSPTVIGTGLPSDARVVGAGDVTGDGHPDLLAAYDDKLWLYAADPEALPTVLPPVRLGASGWDAMTLTAPGDADGDGRPDLLARDTGDSRLWLYRGMPDGTFDARTEYGHSYGTGNRPLLAGAADADGNGVADLWTTTDSGTGTLMFYAGATDAAGNPVDGARTTVGLSGWNSIVLIS